MRRSSSTICTERSASYRWNAIFLPGRPPSPDCSEAGDEAQVGLSVKPAMQAAGDRAQQLLPVPGQRRADEFDLLNRLDRIFRPTVSGIWKPAAAGGAVARGELRRAPAHATAHAQAGAVRGRGRSGTPASRIPGTRCLPYLLSGKTIDQPNQVWSADITYIPIIAKLRSSNPATVAIAN